jgi:hypothetical protein
LIGAALDTENITPLKDLEIVEASANGTPALHLDADEFRQLNSNGE